MDIISKSFWQKLENSLCALVVGLVAIMSLYCFNECLCFTIGSHGLDFFGGLMEDGSSLLLRIFYTRALFPLH
jgi:hypothetical protein